MQSVQDYAIVLLSPVGRVLSWNAGAQRLKGYRAEEILGESFTRFYPPEDVQLGVPQALLERAATEGRVVVEGWRVRNDGSRFWAEVVLTALHDAHGNLRSFAKVTRDLTERKEAEEARARASREEGARAAAEAAQAEVRASRDQLAAILTGVAEGITVQDAAGQLVYANDAAARLCGFPSAPALLAATGLDILDRFAVFDEVGAPFPLEQLPGRRVFRGDVATESLVQFRDLATGDVRWSLVNATPIRDAAGQVQLAVNIFHDVTERRQAEEMARFLSAAGVHLTRSLDYEQTLHEVAQLAVPVLADWCVVEVLNDHSQLRRLAVAHVDPAKERLAQDLGRRYPTDPQAPAGVWHVLRTGQSALVPEITDAQLVAIASDAEHLAMLRSLQMRSVIIVPLVARSRTLGAITLVRAETGHRFGPRDLGVAEELAVRAALAIDNARFYHDAQEQAATLVKLNAALRDLTVRLQETLRTRDEFLAAVSHDLKNPLAAIKGTAQLLSRRLERHGELGAPELQTGLARIDAVVTRAAVQVEELLDVARLQMGRPMELDRQPTDLVALTNEIVAEHQQRSERHQIQVESSVPALIGIWDRQRLTRVVDNTLDNALKYSPDGGEIRVLVDQDTGAGSWAVLRVEDQGMGIPPEDLERIFERFQRGSNVSGQIPGTGLGLASARSIVESHGGTMVATNRPDRGAAITMRLPIQDPASRPLARREESQE